MENVFPSHLGAECSSHNGDICGPTGKSQASLVFKDQPQVKGNTERGSQGGEAHLGGGAPVQVWVVLDAAWRG